uniref:Wiskott-Aldrich syndrome protein family member 2 n=1 Tax=Phallusia mammillata TaxID=59560 RepID=A0A6F9DXS0_9ASCI|nr:wiskott-Aldrich syndrome protein family member 2 [Phallusia mammillata]
MDTKANGKAPAEQSTDNTAGWLFRFIQEGWLRKRWRKRWCILSKGKLYFYEFETRDVTEKNCGQLDLTLYQKCVKASKKDAKKSPHTFILEVEKKDDKAQKAKVKVQREVLYANSDAELELWYNKLNDSISYLAMGTGPDLEHVTKTRAKPPGARRRPPTRQHLRDRATICEISLDLGEEEEKKKEPTKRGHVPTSAIKPPPPGSRKDKTISIAPLKILTPDDTSEENKPEENNKENDEDELPSPPPLPQEEQKLPPPPPSKALKPALIIHTESPPDSVNSSRSNSPAPSRGSSVGSKASRTATPKSLPSSFKSTSSEKDTRTELLKANARLAVLSSSDEEGKPLGRQMKAQSLNILDNFDEDDLPPPPDLPKARSSLNMDKKGKRGKKKNKKRPKSTWAA